MDPPQVKERVSHPHSLNIENGGKEISQPLFNSVELNFLANSPYPTN